MSVAENRGLSPIIHEFNHSSVLCMLDILSKNEKIIPNNLSIFYSFARPNIK